MLQNRATLQQVRHYLLDELRSMYPEGESDSIARMILEHFGIGMADCIVDPARKADPVTTSQINKIVAEIHKRRPIQYILGYTWFCNLKLLVNKSVFIPRPETEEMVCRIAESFSFPPKRIIDLGTGSGCIALAIKQKFSYSDVWGTDTSEDALEISAENGRRNNLEVHWLLHDLLEPVLKIPVKKFDLVISNPPYVLEQERTSMDTRITGFEPASALFVDDCDPLIYYRGIARFCNEHLEKGGTLWVEINERFGAETAHLFIESGMRDATILRDLHEKERFIKAIR